MIEHQSSAHAQSNFPAHVEVIIPEMGRVVAGRLLNVSVIALRIESYVALPRGAQVAVRAQLTNSDFELSFGCE